jgi:hypothetical protein
MGTSNLTQAVVTAKNHKDGNRHEMKISIPSSVLTVGNGGEIFVRSLIEQELSEMGLHSSYKIKSWQVH